MRNKIKENSFEIMAFSSLLLYALVCVGLYFFGDTLYVFIEPYKELLNNIYGVLMISIYLFVGLFIANCIK